MKRLSLVALVFVIFFFSLEKAHSICLPAYPFELSYAIYPGKNSGDVINRLNINAGIRLEGLKAMYVDVSFLADIFLHANKDKGLYGDMLQKDIVDYLSASLNFPYMTKKPISLSLFFGRYDRLGSDSILREYIKSSSSSSYFMKSYPANIFRPDLDVRGVGLALYGATSNGFYTGFYSHWNAKTSDEFSYTNDIRFGFAYSTFSFDSFVGFITKKKGDDFRVRMGLMGNVRVEEYELYFEMGFAKLALHKMSWNELNSQFYALFEPRVVRPRYNVAVSFFMASPFQLPKDLEDEKLRDTSFLGFNVLLGFGNLEEHRVNGGVSILTSINLANVAEVTPFTLSLGPYLTFLVKSMEFNFRIPINPLLSKDLRRAVMAEASVRAVY